MNGNRKLRLPVWAIIFDVLGTLLLALGIYGQFAGESLPMPASFDQSAFSFVLMLAGVLLMLPLIVTIVRQSGR